MEADDRSEPSLPQIEGAEDVSEDSDSGEAIIELDQSQIASASPSDSEGAPSDSVKESESDAAAGLEQKTREFFDTVSDNEDFPDDEPESKEVEGKQPIPVQGELFDTVSDNEDFPDDEPESGGKSVGGAAGDGEKRLGTDELFESVSDNEDFPDDEPERKPGDGVGGGGVSSAAGGDTGVVKLDTKELFESVSDNEDFPDDEPESSEQAKGPAEQKPEEPATGASSAVPIASSGEEGKEKEPADVGDSSLAVHSGEGELGLVAQPVVSAAGAGPSAAVPAEVSMQQEPAVSAEPVSSISQVAKDVQDQPVVSGSQSDAEAVDAVDKPAVSETRPGETQAQVSSGATEAGKTSMEWQGTEAGPQKPAVSGTTPLPQKEQTEEAASTSKTESDSVSVPVQKGSDLEADKAALLEAGAKDSSAASEAVSTSGDSGEPQGQSVAPAIVSKQISSSGDAPKLGEAVSASGPAGGNPADQEMSEETEAAHQAEVERIKDQLRELGAESVSDPESGEDMGSDDSSPEDIPEYSSPAVITSSSRLSLGSSYSGGRDRHNSLPPTETPGSQDRLRSERASSEGVVRPAGTSITEDGSRGAHISLSASLDMENISDDENIGDDDDSTGAVSDSDDKDKGKKDSEDTRAQKVEEAVSSSTAPAETDAQKSSTAGEQAVNGERPRSPIMIASLGNKQQVQTHFNEEQVELDYEDVDGEGDDGEVKGDDDDREDGEMKSDKDEGELDDDDDCEEGEIKEPGSKKPFVKPLCRFYMRGVCTWGLNCRFLHPGVNDKGNYQMIELPGRWNGPPGSMGRPPWGGPDQGPEEPVDLPPPPPEAPAPESAWERGLRHAKEQMKKASQRKEQESNFEEKRLNLSVDEEREMNKENDRRMVFTPKDPYYDQRAYEEDEYYKPPDGMNQWQSGRYENFEVRYNRERSFSPYREKEYYPPPPPAVERYPPRPFSPPVDKFGRHPRDERIEKYRGDPRMVEDIRSPSPPPVPQRRPADEWHDPWQRSKSPKANRRGRSRSRSRRGRRSLSDSSFSSNSRSRSRSAFSRSSRSFSRSSISSRSRSRSPEPAPPGVDRGDRMHASPHGRYMDQPRSAVSVRGRGGAGGGYYRNHEPSGGGGGGFRGGYQGGSYHRQKQQQEQAQERRFPEGYGYNRNSTHGRPQERKIPPGALRPRGRPGSGSSSLSSRSRSRSRSLSGSSSSYSRSRSRSGSPKLGRRRLSGSRSRSASSISSRSSSSSSSSSGSADSDNLYGGLGSPSRGLHSASPKKKAGERMPKRADHIPRRPSASPAVPDERGVRRPDRMGRPDRPERSPDKAARMGHPVRPERAERMENRPDRAERERAERERRMMARQMSHGEREQSSRPPPQAQTKAKDPMKLVGLKSNIKLTLKQPGERPPQPESTPMKRRPTDAGDGPPAKRPALPTSPIKSPFEKAAKPASREPRTKSPIEASRPPRSSAALPTAVPPPPSSIPLPPSPVKAPKARPPLPKGAPPPTSKPAPPPGQPPPEPGKAAAAGAGGAKPKKSMSSRREELLKQLKAVEDAIARKKAKMQ